MKVLELIESSRQRHHPLLAILLDPEKTDLSGLDRRTEGADIVLVGGSTGSETAPLVKALRGQTNLPVVLFPGNPEQFHPDADALLFLSLLSSRDAEWLIGKQIASALAVRQSGIEAIPTGYILIDGGTKSSTARATGSPAIPRHDINRIVATAVAAELSGKRLVYLEAGSGALIPVDEATIQAVRRVLTVPLIVGGGIRTPEQMLDAYRAGADIVVIGNHFEQHPEQIPLFVSRKIKYADG